VAPSLELSGRNDTTPEGGGGGEEALSHEFRERVRFFAFRWVGEADSEDVAQETLRRVIRALRGGHIRNPSRPTAFIFQTARHVCMELRRSHARESRALQRLEREGIPTPVLPDRLQRSVSETSRDLTALAMRELSLDDQNLLRLLYVDGWNTAEVATELGLSAATTRVRKHRALSRLRDVMTDNTPPEDT